MVKSFLSCMLILCLRKRIWGVFAREVSQTGFKSQISLSHQKYVLYILVETGLVLGWWRSLRILMGKWLQIADSYLMILTDIICSFGSEISNYHETWHSLRSELVWASLWRVSRSLAEMFLSPSLFEAFLWSLMTSFKFVALLVQNGLVSFWLQVDGLLCAVGCNFVTWKTNANIGCQIKCPSWV